MEANGSYTFTMLFEPAEEGGYVVTCPALPGLVTEGNTMEEARSMAEDALRLYLGTLIEDGMPIPSDRIPITQPIEVAVLSYSPPVRITIRIDLLINRANRKDSQS